MNEHVKPDLPAAWLIGVASLREDRPPCPGIDWPDILVAMREFVSPRSTLAAIAASMPSLTTNVLFGVDAVKGAVGQGVGLLCRGAGSVKSVQKYGVTFAGGEIFASQVVSSGLVPIWDYRAPEIEQPVDQSEEGEVAIRFVDKTPAEIAAEKPKPTPTGVVHEFADEFPYMPGEDLWALSEDIRENGLRVSIVLDAEGRLIDGRNRLQACKLAGVPPRFRQLRPDEDSVAFILSQNIQRRHMTTGQRVMAIAFAYPDAAPPGRGKKGPDLGLFPKPG